MAVPSVVTAWVDEIAQLTAPDSIVYCDGTEPERDRLVAECLATGELIELNQSRLPGCYLHRSAPHDVARTEHLTFVCTDRADDVGPNNNWMAPADARAKLDAALRRCDAGAHTVRRPLPHGRPRARGSPRPGVQITDSRYVVLNMRIMTRMGTVALEHLAGDPTLHPVPALARRPQPGPPLRHALPGREHHLVGRLRVWRKCSPRQEVPGAAPGQLDGPLGGLAGRAHADPRPREPGRAGALRDRRVSVGVRQDQPGDAGPAREHAGLEGLDGRRRHRLAAAGRATAGCGRSTRRTGSSASPPAPAARPTRTRST